MTSPDALRAIKDPEQQAQAVKKYAKTRCSTLRTPNVWGRCCGKSTSNMCPRGRDHERAFTHTGGDDMSTEELDWFSHNGQPLPTGGTLADTGDHMNSTDPFADCPAGDRYVSVNGNKWLVSYLGRGYVRRDFDREWYGPSDKVYSTEELISNGWRPV